MQDWENNPDNYLKDEQGNFILKVDGTPRKKPGRSKGSKSRGYNYHSRTKATMKAKKAIRTKEKLIEQTRSKLNKHRGLLKNSKETLSKMRLELILSEIIIWIAYFSKGFLIAKIKANLDISRNKEQITKKYLELENKKIISDVQLIKTFPDFVFLSNNVTESKFGHIFNMLISKLSVNAKKKIQF